MKLYRHYKQKPYRLIGVAKHSETLEELVVYETLYDSPNGRLWVRPKEMFFENIEHQGRQIPRFEAMKLRLESHTHVQPEHLELLQSMGHAVFGERWDTEWFRLRLKDRPGYYLTLAFVDKATPIGFKIGYELSPTKYYSWLGGVLPDYRRFGVAQSLMQEHHRWSSSQGYQTVETRTRNHFRGMLALNLDEGFNVVGTQLNSKGELEVILEKSLI